MPQRLVKFCHLFFLKEHHSPAHHSANKMLYSIKQTKASFGSVKATAVVNYKVIINQCLINMIENNIFNRNSKDNISFFFKPNKYELKSPNQLSTTCVSVVQGNGSFFHLVFHLPFKDLATLVHYQSNIYIWFRIIILLFLFYHPQIRGSKRVSQRQDECKIGILFLNILELWFY